MPIILVPLLKKLNLTAVILKRIDAYKLNTSI
jgi:hypothetical protein